MWYFFKNLSIGEKFYLFIGMRRYNYKKLSVDTAICIDNNKIQKFDLDAMVKGLE